MGSFAIIPPSPAVQRTGTEPASSYRERLGESSELCSRETAAFPEFHVPPHWGLEQSLTPGWQGAFGQKRDCDLPPSIS